jgi:hypothetical protein
MAAGVSRLPGPIGPTLRLGKIDGTTLYWARAEQGHTSRVHRAPVGANTAADLVPICVDYEIPGTQSVLPDAPLPGQAYSFLVGATNLCGDGPTRDDTGPTPGNVLPPCPRIHLDSDGDTVENLADNCPLTWNPGLADGDGDFVGDVCDNCPQTFNPGQADTDHDTLGNACDEDDDGDGVVDSEDADPLDPTVCRDVDLDGCDDCSSGTDDPLNDGIDTDLDGTCDIGDGCPTDPAKTEPGVCGCGLPEIDPLATVRDEFGAISYTGNDGTFPWTDDWQESGESDGPDSGILRVASSGMCTSLNCLRIGHEDIEELPTLILTREADLSSALTATLTYDFEIDGFDDSGKIEIRVSGDGGSDWEKLEEYRPFSGGGSESFDITPWIAPDTLIRFETNDDTFTFFLYVDDIQIQYTRDPTDPANCN